MGAKPAVRYPMARDITTLPALRSYLCKDGPDGCIGCECPCAYGTKYWHMREEQRKKAKAEMKMKIRALMQQLTELEEMIKV